MIKMEREKASKDAQPHLCDLRAWEFIPTSIFAKNVHPDTACNIYQEFPINLVIRKNELSGMAARSAVLAPFLLDLFLITLGRWPVIPAKIRKHGK